MGGCRTALGRPPRHGTTTALFGEVWGRRMKAVYEVARFEPLRLIGVADGVRVEARVWIDRPLKDVFAYVTSLDKWPEWRHDVVGGRVLTEGVLGVGSPPASAGSVRSATTPSARTSAVRCSVTRSKMRSVVDVITTRLPPAPRRRAAASPIPRALPAPVTMATRGLAGCPGVATCPLMSGSPLRRRRSSRRPRSCCGRWRGSHHGSGLLGPTHAPLEHRRGDVRLRGSCGLLVAERCGSARGLDPRR